MKSDKRIGAFLPSLKAVGAALALACAGQASVAAVVTSSLGGFGHASAVVTGGGIINFLSLSQTYSTSATNGLVTQSSTLSSPSGWGTLSAVSQANPGGNIAHAGNVNGGGPFDDPFNPIDSAGVAADGTTSTARVSGLGPFTRASGSAFKQGSFNLVDGTDFVTPVAGGIDFTFDYSLLASTAAIGPDNADVSVRLTFDNLSDLFAPAVFFQQLTAAGTRTGTFTYHMDLGAGQVGFLSMSAQAIGVSQIPEPAMLYLVGTGLFGVVMGRRREKTGVAAAA